jgi:hypothetical protein
LLLRSFQFLGANLGAFFLEGSSAGRSPEHHQGEQTEESEKQHHAEPGRESRLRLMAVEWLWRGHD